MEQIFVHFVVNLVEVEISLNFNMVAPSIISWFANELFADFGKEEKNWLKFRDIIYSLCPGVHTFVFRNIGSLHDYCAVPQTIYPTINFYYETYHNKAKQCKRMISMNKRNETRTEMGGKIKQRKENKYIKNHNHVGLCNMHRYT